MTMNLLKKAKDRWNQSTASSHYFEAARSWSDDIYVSAVVSRRRYQLAFLTIMIYAAILTIALVTVVLDKQYFMVVVHQNPSGFNYVSLEKQRHAPAVKREQIESDLVRYVTTRESYHPETYVEQSNLVTLLSDATVKSEYQLTQADNNLAAPIHVLKNKGYRSVTINSILFLDNKDEHESSVYSHSHNLAQVNFTVSDHVFGHEQHSDTPFTALISWAYQGVPTNPEILWQNWSGFTVTAYQVHPVTMTSTHEG